ncbi:helix-turn-helix transcriptional regulator [Brevundimonas sp.]|uniref:helix-turn-helix domain-containing protein n=1 Tax=Brevundimonas sp. TaxID=1871086 RepID=UPI002629D935|nr:helix-turn-helix transcriptional regulator [Brevundimonas sp.]
MAIGDRIKELRVRKGESLQQVADAIGASKAHIWELESNRSKNPSLDLMQKLAGHFRTTVAYLIDEPQGDLNRAEQFFRRNSDKFASLEEDEIAIFENLLDKLAKKDAPR